MITRASWFFEDFWGKAPHVGQSESCFWVNRNHDILSYWLLISKKKLFVVEKLKKARERNGSTTSVLPLSFKPWSDPYLSFSTYLEIRKLRVATILWPFVTHLLPKSMRIVFTSGQQIRIRKIFQGLALSFNSTSFGITFYVTLHCIWKSFGTIPSYYGRLAKVPEIYFFFDFMWKYRQN